MLAAAVISSPIRRKGKKAKRAKNSRVNLALADAVPPTLERALLGDVAEIDARNRSHVRGDMNPKYWVVDALKRLYDRKQLDENSPGMNEAMYLGALKLRDLFRRAGLDSSVGSSDLDRIVGGNGDPAYMMASTVAMMDARTEFRRAVRSMGYYGEVGKPGYFPFRGAGRVVLAVVCHGHAVYEAGALHTNSSGKKARDVAMSKLQDGLAALVSLWRLTGRSDSLRASVVGHRAFAPDAVSW